MGFSLRNGYSFTQEKLYGETRIVGKVGSGFYTAECYVNAHHGHLAMELSMKIGNAGVYFLLAIFCALGAGTPAVADSKPKSLAVCFTPSGKVQAKTKCAKSDKAMTAKSLSSFAASTSGINLATCHVVTNSTSTTVGTTVVSSQCAKNEMMLTYGYFYEPLVSLGFLREAYLYFDGNLPQGVTVVAQMEAATPAQYQAWTMYVNAVCCEK